MNIVEFLYLIKHNFDKTAKVYYGVKNFVIEFVEAYGENIFNAKLDRDFVLHNYFQFWKKLQEGPRTREINDFFELEDDYCGFGNSKYFNKT